MIFELVKGAYEQTDVGVIWLEWNSVDQEGSSDTLANSELTFAM